MQVEDVEALLGEDPLQPEGDCGLRQMFGSEPLAGTITVRPTGITSDGGSSWRPWRGCSARVNVPGGSFPITILTSWPRARSASDLSSACSSTAPQNDHENGTTMPTFIPWEPSDWAVCSVTVFEEGLAELHTHLGGSVASEILWSIAHEQGIALPVKDYWEFDRLVTVSDPRGVPDLNALDAIYHWTELIQSSPLAVERSVHAAIGGAYRSQQITTLELRFNPMKRNRGGERDLDHIIMAAARGLDRASLEYPQVRAGLILMMDRTFDERQNADHRREGDPVPLARHRRDRHRRPSPRRRALPVRAAEAARRRRPRGRPRRDHPRRRGGRRPRHRGDRRGDRGAQPGPHRPRDPRRPRPELMAELRERGIVLEICPTSNLLTKALPDEAAVRHTFRAFVDAGVRFTIATDGPEMMRTHLRDELDLLLRIGALDEDEVREANARGHESSFVRGPRRRGPGVNTRNTPFGLWS